MNINGLQLYGMDDYWGTNFDPVKTMQNYNRNQASLVLCHNPDVADLDVWNGYEGWILSGHTHAGQVRIPFWGSPIIPVSNKNYDQGIKNFLETEPSTSTGASVIVSPSALMHDLK
ncbi:hypothetical protein KUH03_34350 [Sphingobacterium sp. E70]|uniref:hypothetical protein n=1 Tax=Sphingobacterium sp. E70 TaxID=2853439 RepID=UPI00211BAEDF|nr:hypothetical protein [Sphingobacterium sp. E70]ULT24104.1 hypothetical protein KUH03_34350 [Sphingobacterium sp. E70]